MGKINRARLTKIPIVEALKPFNGAEVMTDRYWIVEDECIMFYNGYSAQCNSQKETADYLREKIYPNSELRFLPVVYVKRRD